MLTDTIVPDRTLSIAELYAGELTGPATPPHAALFLRQFPEATARQQADVLLVDQHHRWEAGVPCPVEEYLAGCPAVAEDAELTLDLIVEEYGYRQQQGELLHLDSIVRRFPRLADRLREELQKTPAVSRRSRAQPPGPSAARRTEVVDSRFNLAVLAESLESRLILGDVAARAWHAWHRHSPKIFGVTDILLRSYCCPSHELADVVARVRKLRSQLSIVNLWRRCLPHFGPSLDSLPA